MGVDGLWKVSLDGTVMCAMWANVVFKILEGAAKTQSLRTLAIREGYERDNSDHLYRIGVDVR